MVEQPKNCTRLQIFSKCSKLINPFDLSERNTFVTFYQIVADSTLSKIGSTEIVCFSKDLNFSTPLNINYFFEENQEIRCNIICPIAGETEENDQNLLGYCNFFIGQLLGSRGQSLANLIRSSEGKNMGYIIFKAEQVVESNNKVAFAVSGKKIEDVSGMFSPFEPFFCFSRALADGGKQLIYKSSYENGKNAVWKSFEVSLEKLCLGDYSQNILVEVFDNKTLGDHEFIASTTFNLNQVLNERVQKFELINEKKKRNKQGYKNSGYIIFESCKLVNVYTFLDYIKGGCHISLDIAVDFTGSNKHPSSQSSLHYIDKDQSKLNHYQQALKAVSEILLPYNSDKKVGMYGFGGKIDNVISHCFPLTNTENPYVYGVEGIMDVYKSALGFVGLSGPTRFSDLLKTIVESLENETVKQDQQKYKLLLILTDGEIDDMQETINWIVRGSACPLSIVIVGIGNENFQKMQILDADENALVDSEGKKMLRDIVQFVPFRELNNSPTLLAKEILDEIPREIVNFFTTNGIMPNTPIEAPFFTFKSNLDELV